MNIYEPNGWMISRSSQVTGYIFDTVCAEPLVTGIISDLSLNPQTWGGGGCLHFSGVHIATRIPVLLKVGVNAHEIRWTSEVSQRAPHLCPALFASGTQLADLQIGWMISEVIPYGPLGPLWKGNEFEFLLQAGVEFQLVARDISDAHLPHMSRKSLLQHLQHGVSYNPPGPATALLAHFDDDFDWFANNCEWETCHGDLHLCNGLTRNAPPCGPAVLIDYQPIHQPWAFDAAYLQLLNSIDPNRAGCKELIPRMAAMRKVNGMATNGDVEKIARLALGWFAIWRWGCDVDRQEIDGYRLSTQGYIEEALAAR